MINIYLPEDYLENFEWEWNHSVRIDQNEETYGEVMFNICDGPIKVNYFLASDAYNK